MIIRLRASPSTVCLFEMMCLLPMNVIITASVEVRDPSFITLDKKIKD